MLTSKLSSFERKIDRHLCVAQDSVFPARHDSQLAVRSGCQKWAELMGGANNRSLISAHFCVSAYFLTAETYKRMRLTTRVYGIIH